MQPFTLPNDPKVLETIRSKIAAYDWEIMRILAKKIWHGPAAWTKAIYANFVIIGCRKYQWADSLAGSLINSTFHDRN